jgi:gliding motility-associated protein GldM
MSIPKEPRQLMINLMYLVLTAMLALNVSAEIINAFFMLDKGIKHTNEIVDLGVEATIKQMKGTLESKPNLKPIAEAAEAVPAKIKTMLEMVNKLRVDITEQSGGLNTLADHKAKWEGYGYKKFTITTEKKLDGKPVGYKDKDVTHRIFVDEGRGEALKKQIAVTRKELLAVVDDLVAKLEKEPIKGVQLDKKAIEELKKDLVLEEPDDKVWQEAGKKDWANYVFAYMPVASCYPLLRKFENDAKNAASQIVNFLAANMGNKVLVYDKFDVFSQSKKGYILLGETYEAEIALGAYSSQAKFSVNVNGSNLAIDGAKAKYSARPSSVGTQRYSATINVTNPQTGEIETVKKDFEYEVGVPSITVAADKMNVFYIGVDNPISVSAAGMNSADVSVTISGAGGGTISGSGSKYMVKATSQTAKDQYCNIVVTNKKTGKSMGSYPFRVKRIPDPQARLTNNKTDGAISNGEMRAMTGLMAVLDNFDFDARCEIQGFTLWFTAPRQDPVSTTVAGGKFDAKAMQMVAAAKPGASYQFVDVKGRCPGDTAGRKLNGLAFQVK